MDGVRELLAPGGVLYLTVPIGADLLVWNLHRRYGPLRLPLLLDGWQVDARFGWEEDKLSEDGNFRKSYEPVFVLRKPLDGSELQAAAPPVDDSEHTQSAASTTSDPTRSTERQRTAPRHSDEL